MTAYETFKYLLYEYNKGSYSTGDFCELFTLYYRDLDLDLPSEYAEKWMDGLDELCGRFSDIPEDFVRYPGVYCDEKVIKAYTKEFSPELLQSGRN